MGDENEIDRHAGGLVNKLIFSAMYTISYFFCLNVLVYEVNAVLVVRMELGC